MYFDTTESSGLVLKTAGVPLFDLIPFLSDQMSIPIYSDPLPELRLSLEVKVSKFEDILKNGDGSS